MDEDPVGKVEEKYAGAAQKHATSPDHATRFAELIEEIGPDKVPELFAQLQAPDKLSERIARKEALRVEQRLAELEKMVKEKEAAAAREAEMSSVRATMDNIVELNADGVLADLATLRAVDAGAYRRLVESSDGQTVKERLWAAQQSVAAMVEMSNRLAGAKRAPAIPKPVPHARGAGGAPAGQSPMTAKARAEMVKEALSRGTLLDIDDD